MALPVGIATVERSFSQMKLIKTCLRSRLSDSNLEHLIEISIDCPPLTNVDFKAILNILNRKIVTYLVLQNSLYCNFDHNYCISSLVY